MTSTPNHHPKQLIQKKPDYVNDSFASWLEKTLFTTVELGDLSKLNANILQVIEAAANEADDVEKINLVEAVNETWNETRRVLIRAIGMS